jgi:threonylcarbamoyladenosine tRNA methylthiotransferase MtaB
VLTTGCRLNQSESDALRHKLLLQGVRLVAEPSQADVCYVNTCTVTAAADRSSMQQLHRARRACPRVVALGCLAERDPDRLRAAGADEVWPNASRQRALAGCRPAPARSRALLKVQDGCGRRCAYCVVSGLRGRPWSLPVPAALAQFQSLAGDGFGEVVLTGLNLGSYESEGTDLAGLVRSLLHIPGPRIRIGSVEPDSVTDWFIALVAEPRVCPHVHLPLQSGDDAILQAMHRPYRTDDYRRAVERLRRVRPDINIGADVIAGFPGETDASFERTLDVLARTPVSYLHAFGYSPRPGTEAALLPDRPAPAAVRARVRRLRDLSTGRRREYGLRFLGQTRTAVIESTRSCLTDNYLSLPLAAATARRGALADVLIEARDGRLAGRLI